MIDPVQRGGDGGGLPGAGGTGDEDEALCALDPRFQEAGGKPELGQGWDFIANGPHHGGEPTERVIEIYPQSATLGDAPRDVCLKGGRGIDAAGFPELFHVGAWDRSGMKHDHLALAADTWDVVFDKENVVCLIRKRVADELVESGVHGTGMFC